MWEERHEEVFLCRGYAKLAMAVAVVVGGYETKERKERKKREKERQAGRERKGQGRPDSGQEASNAAAGMHRRFVSVRRPRQECEA